MRVLPYLALAGALGVAAGCQGAGAARSPGDAAKVAACRAQTDRVYRAQNRGAIFLPNDQRDSPFSSSYDPGLTSRGLSGLFGRDQEQAECLHELGERAPGDASTGPAFTPR
jgi:hypothetical protein